MAGSTVRRRLQPAAAALPIALAAALATVLASVPAGATPAPQTAAAPTLDKLDLGTWWFGPHVTKADLVGKVVLYVMWGSTTGSKQITPDMIALARRLEGKPFHLLASHCEDISSRKEVVAYVEANGLSPNTPDFTIVKEGRHPDIHSPGGDLPKYPYYVLFDPSGRAVDQALAGTYFGGDGRAFVQKTEDLVAKAAAVWVGDAPFAVHADLARQVAAAHGLNRVAKRIESLLAAQPEDASRTELERLQGALARWRDQRLAYARALEGTRPCDVLREVKQVDHDLHGTALGAPAAQALKSLSASKRLKDGCAVEKHWRSLVRAYERVKEGHRSEAFIQQTVKKTEALVEGRDDLPVVATVRAWLARVR
jgi:hypothetical protein